jgi:hypothetical protein
MHSSSLAAIGALFLALSSPTFADDPADGFHLSALPYPGQALTATLSDGDLLAFDGVTLDRFDEAGVFEATLTTFSPAVWTGFLAVHPDEEYALVGESSNGVIYRIDLALGGKQALATLAYNFDADFEDLEHALISAATCGFGCGNEIHRLDTVSGVTTLVATVAGSSGPVALSPTGDLYYGTVSDAFPPPTGASSILRWSAAQLTGNPVVDELDAVVIGAGFEAASSLLLDPTDERLYLAENDYGSGLNRIREVNGPAASAPLLLEGTPGNWITNLEFFPGDGVALFRPYQPDRGGRLLYNSTEFVTSWERNELLPRRPHLTLSGPGTTGIGDIDLALHAAVPGGLAWLYYGPSTLFDPAELAIWLPAQGFSAFVGLDLATIGSAAAPFSLDGDGEGVKTIWHDGTLFGAIALQVLVLDGQGVPWTISEAAFL